MWQGSSRESGNETRFLEVYSQMRSGDETRYRRSGMSVSSESGGILVRGFPSWLGGQEKKSLLTHFGASEVTPMANRGRMVSRRICLHYMFNYDCFLSAEKLCVCSLLQS